MQETWVQFLDWEDPLEEGMGKHSSILALKIPWTEEPGRLQSVGCKESEMTERLHFFFFTFIMLGLLSRSVMYDCGPMYCLSPNMLFSIVLRLLLVLYEFFLI